MFVEFSGDSVVGCMEAARLGMRAKVKVRRAHMTWRCRRRVKWVNSPDKMADSLSLYLSMALLGLCWGFGNSWESDQNQKYQALIYLYNTLVSAIILLCK